MTNAAEDVEYEEGRDYTVDVDRRLIVRAPRSRMTVYSPDAAGVGALLHRFQSTVTYTHRERWRGTVPRYAGALLPRTSARLRRREPVTICLTGDSISEGYDSSGFHGLRPHRPAYATLVKRALVAAYGARIELHNLATAGWTTDHAMWDVERIAAPRPDLVIVAYGMNDATYADADTYIENIGAIVDGVRRLAPAAEALLVSPMLPTPACTWVVRDRFDDYRRRLAGIVAPGTAVADVTTIWADLIRLKDDRELSGNGLNHPNDFGHRIYADVIGAALIESAE